MATTTEHQDVAHTERLRTAVPVVVALTLLAGVTAAALWALHDLLAFGVWFLGSSS